VAEGNDLRRHRSPVAAGEQQPIADAGVSGETVDVDDQAGQSVHAARQPERRDVAQTGAGSRYAIT
jgi:hypothetical protein